MKTEPDALTGRELDAWIAEHVMGRKVRFVKSEEFEFDEGDGTFLSARCNFGGAEFTADREWLVDEWLDMEANVEMAHYSTDIAAAFEVIERIRELGFYIQLQSYPALSRKWRCLLCSEDGLDAANVDAPTVPEAICLAAKAAIEQGAPA